MSKIKFISGLICISLVVGCAANSPKHFDKKLAQLDRKGLVLATVTSDNRLDYNLKFQPGAFFIRKNSEDVKTYTLIGGNHFRVCTGNKKFCLIVLEVNRGDHFISKIQGVAFGAMFAPVYQAQVWRNFQANENEILYIGNIHMVIRKKVSDSEISAAVLYPGRILSAAILAGTTIDIEINDEYKRDMNEFEKAFPNLKGHTVIKKILPLQPISYVD